ncbi:MAG: Clp1/GlmU family protein [Nitrospirota bacterium]|nr:Clp1/GlmU family protein [Nitrospirota bacterium]
MDIHAEPEWESLYDELACRRGTALFLGMTDTGKSTLVRYLLKRFVTEGIKVSLVDSDIGQSSLGLPGTVSMRVFRDKKDLEEFRWKKMSFLGTVNPAKAMTGVIRAAEMMTCLCREKADMVLVDTTGLVTGAIGRALKTGKIRALNPEYAIAVQKKDELEHILSRLDDHRIVRLRNSPEAKARSRAVRFRYRNRKLAEYFAGRPSSVFSLHMNEVRFLYHDKPFSPGEAYIKEKMIIGLNHNEVTLALGIVEKSQLGRITFMSRLASLKKINTVVLGDMFLQKIPEG